MKFAEYCGIKTRGKVCDISGQTYLSDSSDIGNVPYQNILTSWLIYGLFKDAVNSWDYTRIASNRILINDFRQVVVKLFEIVSRYFPG
jgi:hypothetical protein